MFGPFVRRYVLPCLMVAAWAFVGAEVVEACPGCADGQAGQGAERANIVNGYFWSILFMMSMPFLLLGGFGTYCYVQVRTARAERAAATPATPNRSAPVRGVESSPAPGSAPSAGPAGPTVFTGG